MVALVIMAVVAMIASQSFSTAASSATATREAMERLAKIDRTFFLIEQDLRNVLPRQVAPEFGEALPPLQAAMRGQEYWLTVLRGGFANPLYQLRTEEVRVGYRYVDNEIWRDVWYDIRLTDQRESRQQRLLDNVREMNLRILAANASSLAAGPWLQDWPPTGLGGQMALPRAIEVTLELDDMGEITRLYSLLPGAGPELADPDGGRNPPDNGADGDDNAS